MSQHMPQHRFPSHGRRDSYQDAPAPMTITSATQQQPSQADQPTTFTQQWFDAVARVPDAQRQYLAAQRERDLTPDELLKAAREFAAPELDVAEAAFKKQADHYDAQYAHTVAGLTANVDESSAARIRDRAFDRLAHAESPILAAQQLIESAGTPQELGVVLQEVPSWLEARGHGTDWLPSKLAEVQPDVAQAATKRRKAHQARDLGLTTIAQVRRGIDTACPVTHLMPADRVSKYDPER